MKTYTVREFNKRVFWFGTLIAILGGPLLAYLSLKWFPPSSNQPGPLSDMFSTASMGGALNVPVFLFIIIGGLILLIALVQIVIYFFLFFNTRLINLSGVKQWIFYAFELLIGFLPFRICISFL